MFCTLVSGKWGAQGPSVKVQLKKESHKQQKVVETKDDKALHICNNIIKKMNVKESCGV